MSWDHYDTTPVERVHFDLAFQIEDDVGAGGGIGLHEIDAHRAVEVAAVGLPQIARAWDVLYDEWLPTSGFGPDDLPAMRRFRSRPDEVGWERWGVACRIPVRPLRP